MVNVHKKKKKEICESNFLKVFRDGNNKQVICVVEE